MDKRGRYFLGVGVGLIISWVTGALAYTLAGPSSFPEIIELEFAVSIICFIVAYLVDTERKSVKRRR